MHQNRLLTVLVVVFLLLTGIVSLLLPLDETPDEKSHFDLVRFIAEQHRPPQTIEERQMIGVKGDASPLYHSLVALLTQHVDVSSLPERHRIGTGGHFIPYDGVSITSKLHNLIKNNEIL